MENPATSTDSYPSVRDYLPSGTTGNLVRVLLVGRLSPDTLKAFQFACDTSATYVCLRRPVYIRSLAESAEDYALLRKGLKARADFTFRYVEGEAIEPALIDQYYGEVHRELDQAKRLQSPVTLAALWLAFMREFGEQLRNAAESSACDLRIQLLEDRLSEPTDSQVIIHPQPVFMAHALSGQRGNAEWEYWSHKPLTVLSEEILPSFARTQSIVSSSGQIDWQRLGARLLRDTLLGLKEMALLIEQALPKLDATAKEDFSRYLKELEYVLVNLAQQEIEAAHIRKIRLADAIHRLIRFTGNEHLKAAVELGFDACGIFHQLRQQVIRERILQTVVHPLKVEIESAGKVVEISFISSEEAEDSGLFDFQDPSLLALKILKGARAVLDDPALQEGLSLRSPFNSRAYRLVLEATSDDSIPELHCGQSREELGFWNFYAEDTLPWQDWLRIVVIDAKMPRWGA